MEIGQMEGWKDVRMKGSNGSKTTVSESQNLRTQNAASTRNQQLKVKLLKMKNGNQN